MDNTGITGSKYNIIPEYHSFDKVEFSNGDILKVFDKNGNLIESYIFEIDVLDRDYLMRGYGAFFILLKNNF